MAETILTAKQTVLLRLISRQKEITHNFYLTGGTALAVYYLHHRYSEDLDFFTKTEFDPIAVQVMFKKIQEKAKIKAIDFQQSYNRNLFFLHFTDEIIKTEFTYFPFEQIEKPRSENGITIDSLLDIAVNKLFTIYQKPRSRDFIDLYIILKQKKWMVHEMTKKAQIKFDTYIDPLQLGQQILQVTELKDYPRMKQDIKQHEWQTFWLSEAHTLKKQALV